MTDVPEFFPDYIKFTRQFSQVTPSFLEFREIIMHGVSEKNDLVRSLLFFSGPSIARDNAPVAAKRGARSQGPFLQSLDNFSGPKSNRNKKN